MTTRKIKTRKMHCGGHCDNGHISYQVIVEFPPNVSQRDIDSIKEYEFYFCPLCHDESVYEGPRKKEDEEESTW